MFLMLLLFWLIFNGRVTWEIVLVGAVVSGTITFLWHKVFHTKKNTVLPSWRTVRQCVGYFGHLVVEIVECNIRVMRLILHPKDEIHPQLVTFRTKLKDENHKVVLANSITLTPGTITVGMQDDLIRVHGLDASFMEGIEHCEMVERLEKMEEEHV